MRLRPVLLLRLLAGGVAVSRLSRARHRRPPLAEADRAAALPSITVVVPARDEAKRIGPLLAALRAAPRMHEVLVVDDESSDATAAVARAAGADVITGAPLPAGWAGKAWALQQGVTEATGEWVVTLDADTRPSPLLAAALVSRALRDGLRFVTVGGRFECPTSGLRWLHPAMLTTLVYRFGPPDAIGRRASGRVLANGQCMAFPREALLASGGFSSVADRVVEDVALARHLAGIGWPVAMLDGPDLLTTRMFEDLGDGWRGWSRSLCLPGVEPRWRQLTDLGVVLLAQALPLPRLMLRHGDAADVALVALRLGTLFGTSSAYARRGPAYWLSPLADLPAAAALAAGVARSSHTWRGRTY